MKGNGFAVVWCSLLASTVGATDSELSPVTRVVELLNSMAMKTELEGKAEEKLYEKFACWAKTVIDTKTASNAAAQSRIDSLTSYIADIDAGRVEFTTERQDLEKELEEINGAIDAATMLREKEHEEFLDADDEMNKALTALDAAILVLKEASDGHAQGVLLAQEFRGESSEGFAARAEEAASLSHAADLGQRFLTKADALFLRRLLTGDVPPAPSDAVNADWHKLNRKAQFKMRYKARSLKIQDVLINLKNTFTTSTSDARAKEQSTSEAFKTLMLSKNDQKAKTEKALEVMAVENGARGMNKEDAQDEVDALTTQMSDDTRFLKETGESLALKKEEWVARKALREQELAAFSKAVAILHNDDARDLFKRSFKSQGYMFLQTDMSKHRLTAAAQLRQAATATSDARLTLLAMRIMSQTGSHFKEVIGAIDKMVEVLQTEENQDLKNKEMCEKDRAENTRNAAVLSRKMDETVDAITKLRSEIEEIKAEVSDKKAAVKTTEELLAEAVTLRGAETEEWKTTDADDREASETVKQAKAVLHKFYTDNNLMFAQEQPNIVAGQAPPPPPTTWEAPYAGKTEQSTGILAILEMIVEDIESDTLKAKTAEDEAQAAFLKFSGESVTHIRELLVDISDLEKTEGEKEGAASEHGKGLIADRSQLKIVMKAIDDADPGCNFITANYAVRRSNRLIEIDGLRKAKTILSGGKFDTTDPNREIKPGDALFLQKRAE